MNNACRYCSPDLILVPALPAYSPPSSLISCKSCKQNARPVRVFASKSGGFSLKPVVLGCKTCKGKGAIECPGCKGTGKNKKNGNIFERWKCFDCQGFGMKSCPNCGKGGLTPEQRGER
ncbi:hypothetical protein Tsubulata_037972 [Turnera subulata]|uniref:CR-type domain-containing protein n=1 Tax=Turnera subulata TaxID=218843 RepID=A0A9Q0JGU0_9ROSI|nr:hypothetical protein Tsubulata_037972 [Turnera subulata]